jgi:glucose/arabinose dehydrogenase
LVRRAAITVVWLGLGLSGAAAARLPDGFDAYAIVSGLRRPTSMAFLPDGRLLVAEQDGWLRLVEDERLLATPFLRIAVDATVERGLLGVAVDPLFPARPFVYVYYTSPEQVNRVSRFPVIVTPDAADPAGEQVLLNGIPSSHFHNGGALHFLADGTLLVAVGDRLQGRSAESLGELSGKLLRLTPEGVIPADNPFLSRAGARGEVWALGLRNPFSFAVDPVDGRVYVNDVGDKDFEEINRGAAGANYGWPSCEGPCRNAAFQGPIHSYDHSQGCAITGAVFARGLRFPPQYEGAYLFADYCGRFIHLLTPAGHEVAFADSIDGDAVDLDVGPDGSLYYLSYRQGVIGRVEFVGEGNHRPAVRAGASPDAGSAPLRVALNAEASDPDADPLQFTWEFGDGAPPAPGPSQTHDYLANGPYPARVTVSDGRGGQARATVTIRVGRPPLPRILAPGDGVRFRPGQEIEFAGEAADPDAGALPPAALTWVVELHHHAESDPNHHVHPFLGPLSGAAGRFVIPTELHDSDIFYRIRLTATDADGLTAEAQRDLRPR